MVVECREIESRLEGFIAEELLEERFDGRDPLATGAVDSLGLEQLIAYIEEEFGVQIGNGELAGDYFASIANLAAFVSSKQVGREA
jgi:acyl carrier protein